MKTLYKTFILFLLFFGNLYADTKIILKYKFSEGKHHDMISNGTVKLYKSSKKINFKFRVRIKYLSVSGNKRYAKVKYIYFLKNKTIDLPVAYIMNHFGNVIKVVGNKSVLRVYSIFSNFFLFEMPNKKVYINDTWKTWLTLQNNVKITVNTIFKKILNINNYKIAVLNYKRNSAKIKFNNTVFKLNISGILYFDIKRGMIYKWSQNATLFKKQNRKFIKQYSAKLNSKLMH